MRQTLNKSKSVSGGPSTSMAALLFQKFSKHITMELSFHKQIHTRGMVEEGKVATIVSVVNVEGTG